ncbi:RING/U-box superfamily protein [Euphorbia peplus]|nr:RING/U-box superfamily protein [Euphorbia peplus]
MSAEEISRQNGLNAPLLFQDDTLRFNCSPRPHRRAAGDDPPPSKISTRFIDEKLFPSASNDRFFSPQFPRNMFRENRNWNVNTGTGSSDDESGGEDDEEDDPDDNDDDDDDDGDDGGNCDHDVQMGVDKSNSISKRDTNTSTLDKLGNGKLKPHSCFGSSGEVMVLKDGGGSNVGQQGNNGVTIAVPDSDVYYTQYLQGMEGSGSGGKDVSLDNSCSFSGRKEGSSLSSESGESLRAILSDPATGALMDDAMILPCGHSFGAGGIQHIIRMKACYTCSQSVSEDSIAPNLSLQAAVQAFRREDELQFCRVSKRRRERFDQDKGGFGDSNGMGGRGVQFPFAVADRVIIKGNKRTPQRFVGREAIVTTQCLNGWYVVKTLDNAESVKLQYRSLAKVSDDPSSKVMPSKMAPNWL